MGEGLGDGTLEKWAFGRIGVLASSLDGLAAVGLEVGQHGGSRGHTLPMEGGGGFRWGILLGMPPSPRRREGGPLPWWAGQDDFGYSPVRSIFCHWAGGGTPSGAWGRGGAFDGGVLLGMPPSPGVKRGGPCHGGPDRMILDTRQFARYFATGLEGARFPGPGAGGRYF
ncbi:uncharacterized protein N7487_007078 [Penicillium crustosum]|uniref:uncharacterized protein n=1 Tax=Penicillium crustosum TaxID=36656 RepID=UPI0023A1E35C|nr:uncharacterized protein N7487_007078 [Penicillium crustosum]KAJ5401182.1 hypothetical protein N7487_007078 [Penicillium crustosum]